MNKNARFLVLMAILALYGAMAIDLGKMMVTGGVALAISCVGIVMFPIVQDLL